MKSRRHRLDEILTRTSWLRTNWFGVAIVVILLLMVFGVSFRRIDPLQVDQRLSAGSTMDVRIIDTFTSSYSWSSMRKRTRGPYPPYSVEFTSTSGAVDAYLVRVSFSGKLTHAKYIDKIKTDFAAGVNPPGALHLTSRTGRFYLSDLPLHPEMRSAMLLIRSTKDTDVTVVIRY